MVSLLLSDLFFLLSDLKHTTYITSLGGDSVEGSRLRDTILILKEQSFSKKMEVQFN